MKKNEDLNPEVLEYNLEKNKLNNFLSDLKELIIENSKLIMDCNKEDVKVYKKKIKIEEFISIIDKYKNSECILESNENRLVIYKGDPYITLHVCLQALIKRIKVTLMYDEFMLGVNYVLLQIINKSLKKYSIFNLIHQEKYSIKRVYEIENSVDKIIVIGDTTMYQALDIKKEMKYFPYNNVMIYCEDEEFEKLQNAIYIYANENQYEIEVLYEDTLEDAIDVINAEEFANIAILLTKSNISKVFFKEKIKNKEVYVNSNPFKNEFEKVYNYLV